MSRFGLAYSYENYLVSCQLCNQKFKKDRFPVRHTRMRGPRIRRNTTAAYIESKAGTLAPNPLDRNQVNKFIEGHEQERPLLINPYVDDPAAYFAWRADDVLKEVELVPVANAPDTQAFCDAAAEYYGLNRQELKSHRYFIYTFYRQLKRILQETGISVSLRRETLQMIIQMQEPQALFSGMVRFLESTG